jgi:hypothetical protein
MRTLLLALLLLPLAISLASGARAAPAADLWPRWQAHDPANAAAIDYADWDALLARVVVAGSDGINRVDYLALAGPERAALDAVVARLAAVAVDGYARPEQLAYWINLYNAATLQVVAAHWPVDSIREIDISPGWFSDGPWDAEVVRVAGEALTLNDIEHRILRPIWRDPRIHYAVNCASLGCPNLAASAYRGAGIEVRLEAAARAFVNHPRGLAVRQGRVTVSKIYEWYREDFGAGEAGLIAHLAHYAEPELRARLRAAGAIDGAGYDWRLNATGE